MTSEEAYAKLQDFKARQSKPINDLTRAVYFKVRESNQTAFHMGKDFETFMVHVLQPHSDELIQAIRKAATELNITAVDGRLQFRSE